MFDSVDDIITIGTVTFICTVLLRFMFSRKQGNLPPGPKGYPLIGNFFYLKSKPLDDIIRECRAVYGDIFTLQLFNTSNIICSGREVLEEMFVKNSQIFRDRGPTSAESVLFNGKGLFLSTGEEWKRNRKFVVQTLKCFGMGKNNFEIKIHEEVKYLVDRIDGLNGESFDIKQLLQYAVSNIISSLVFGSRFDYDDKEFTNAVHNLSEALQISLFCKPLWFAYIPGDPLRVREYHKKISLMKTFYMSKMDEHFKEYDPNNIKDFIDVYIQQMKEHGINGNDSFTNADELLRLIHELFAAGTETTSSALRWGLIHLIRNPNIQATIHKELDANVSPERLPALANKPDLPYFQSTVLEILRCGNIAPVVNRGATKDTEFRGYSIPQSACVVANLESVLFDEELWKEPRKFDPSRFIESVDSKQRMDNLISFGLGPRICPGESLARMELYLILGALLRRYEFLPSQSDEVPSLEYFTGITRTPKPFKLRAIRRSLKHS